MASKAPNPPGVTKWGAMQITDKPRQMPFPAPSTSFAEQDVSGRNHENDKIALTAVSQCSVRARGSRVRLAFAKPVSTPEDARAALIAVLQDARHILG